MVRMFKSLEDTRLRGFLEGTTYVFENAVTEFFANAKVVAGTIISTVCNRKLAVTEDIFSETFKLPTEGLTVLVDIQKTTIIEMQHKFSTSEMPFKISGKKREMHFKYLLLHDIVAKSLCAKAGSFDSVTCEKLEFMTAISAGISVNWGRILFQRLLGMVQNSKKQSRGYTVPISTLLTTLVQADLGESIKLHSKKVLTSRSVQAYIKQNQDIIPEGEPSTREDTASNPETSLPHQEKPAQTESLAVVKEKAKNNHKKKDGGKKKRTKKVIEMATQTVEQQTVEERRPVAPTNFDSEEVSEPDSYFVKKRRTQRPHPQTGWTTATFASQPDPTPVSPTEQEGTTDDQMAQGSGGNHFEIYLEFDARKEHEEQQDQEFTADECAIQNELVPVEEYCQQLFTSAWNNVSARMTMFEEWLHFRQEVRLKDISSVESLVEIEEQLLEWGETEEISDLFEHHSLIMNKLSELELEKLYHEHLARFKLDVPSVNRDFECIRRLHKELRVTAAGAEQTTSPQLDHPGHETPAMTSHEHQAQENEPAIQKDEHRTEGNEHQALDELVQGSNQTLEDRPAVFVPFDQHDSNHQGPAPTNLQLIASASADSSTLQLLDTAAQMADELAVVKSQLAALVEGLREFGAAKKGEGGQSRSGEGSSGGGPSNIRGRGLSLRGGRGSSSEGGRGPNQRSDQNNKNLEERPRRRRAWWRPTARMNARGTMRAGRAWRPANVADFAHRLHDLEIGQKLLACMMEAHGGCWCCTIVAPQPGAMRAVLRACRGQARGLVPRAIWWRRPPSGESPAAMRQLFFF
ncbi:hypothetical protein F511_02709 [Dorcoceras hygrometricum]|uniref:Uncharacterized protein n=1 Tax=Dorcoceras hygrometricum TaxID=472368 RepID=A0A2Z7CTC6_9LAMI|nr:hypothetical protein F511_02709 [Dorcoceras hygrometricum]